MTPLLPYLLGIGTTVSTRILMGEISLPDALRSHVVDIADTLSDAADLMDELRSPALRSWIKLGEHGLRKAIDAQCFANFGEWADEMELSVLPNVSPLLTAPLFITSKHASTPELTEEKPHIYPGEKDDPQIFKVGERGELYLILSQKHSLEEFRVACQGGEINIPYKLYASQKNELRKEALEVLEEQFWACHGDQILIDAEQKILFVVEERKDDFVSAPPIEEKVSQWVADFLESPSSGIYLAGEDGSGKSRTARLFGRLLIEENLKQLEDSQVGDTKSTSRLKRELIVTSSAIRCFSSKRWRAFVSAIKPSVVVFDELETKDLPAALLRSLFDEDLGYVSIVTGKEQSVIVPRYLDEARDLSVTFKDLGESLVDALWEQCQGATLTTEVRNELSKALAEKTFSSFVSQLRRASRLSRRADESRQKETRKESGEVVEIASMRKA